MTPRLGKSNGWHYEPSMHLWQFWMHMRVLHSMTEEYARRYGLIPGN